jgi:hypothetical protein
MAMSTRLTKRWMMAFGGSIMWLLFVEDGCEAQADAKQNK